MTRSTAPTTSKRGGSKTRVVTRKVTTPPSKRRSQTQRVPAPASSESPRCVPGPAAAQPQPQPRGRPRELPSRLPQLMSLVAVAPELREIVPRSSRSITEAERVRLRVAKQAAVAEVLDECEVY